MIIFMAITTTIAIPSLNIQHPQSPSIHSSSSSSCKFNPTVISHDEISVSIASIDSVTLANAAVEAAKQAKALVWFNEDNENSLIARRKKRRKRRKGFDEYLEMEKESDEKCENDLFQNLNNGYLSSIQEAECCLCLQDQARLEAATRIIAETQEHEPTLNQLAQALRMKKKNVNKILFKERQSRERIIHNYRGLILSIASNYRGKGLSLQDLIQEGTMGLLRGAEQFDPRRGNRLSTYVYWKIREAIITSIKNKSRLVRISDSLWDNIPKITEAKRSLSKRLGRLPTCEEIAEALNVQVSTVRHGFMRSKSPVSLDRTLFDDGGMTLQEITPGSAELTPEKMVKKQQLKPELEKYMQTLSEREALILRLLFGLDGQVPKTYDEIARSLKLSSERIRQIDKIALSKLRNNKTIADNLKVYINV